MTAEPDAEFVEKGYRLLYQGKYELTTGDSVQASEKLWGAAAQMVKGVAAKRRWPHRTHRDLFSVITRLMQETGDHELPVLFAVASDLHQNFYEQLQPIELVESKTPAIERLVQKLARLAQA